MVLEVGNVVTTVHTGGTDFLLSLDIEKELDKYLRVPMKDAYWVRKKGNLKGWDGNKHYYMSRKFPTGLLPFVLKFAKARDIKVTITDVRENLPVFREEFRNEFGNQTLRDYQEEAVKVFNSYLDLPDGSKLFWPRGIINAATNSGKNLISLGLMDNIENVKCLFLIHSQDIFSQAVEAFEPFFEVGQINSKKCEIKEVTVAMIKTLLNRAESSLEMQNKLKNYFNLVIIDEGHHAGAAEYQKLMKLTNAGARVIVSGTALENEDQITNMNIIAISGPVLKVVTNKELIDKGVSAVPTIHLHKVTYPAKSRMYLSYEDVKTHNLHKSEERTKVLIDALREDILAGKQILITFLELSHGYFMYERLKYLLPPEIKLDIVHGKDTFRATKIKKFKNYEINVMLTSIILKEGMNIPNIEVLAQAQGGKSKITVKQFTGRGLRMQEGKQAIKILDFYDDCNYLDEHSRKRIQIYKNEGFEIVAHYPNKNFKPCVLK